MAGGGRAVQPPSPCPGTRVRRRQFRGSSRKWATSQLRLGSRTCNHGVAPRDGGQDMAADHTERENIINAPQDRAPAMTSTRTATAGAAVAATLGLAAADRGVAVRHM